MNERQIAFLNLLNDVSAVADASLGRDAKLQKITELLMDRVAAYNWVGFYLVDSGQKRTLLLGPFSGEPTTHTQIPFGKGICGQAAETEKVFIVDDVTAEDNYLSCSINVKSEIVLPIHKNGAIIGELDIDSHTAAAFDSEDQEFLSKICDIASRII
ncbi:Putative GAF sensor protein (fragment) [Candidatus Zixiibacteriota bacterium]